jgi:type IV pilus assembly protein PilW
MVALVLGLLLTTGVIGVFLFNREGYRQNENLARLQESARYAFEVMGRDLREAGGIGCGSNLPTANVLNNAAANWWSNWGNGARGYEGNDNTFPKAFGAGAADRASGTDAVVVYSGTFRKGLAITDHNPSSAQFKVNTTAHGFEDGDILMACDYKQAAIFQVTNANSSNVTIVHNTGSSVNPGNCSKGLGYPTVCTTNGTPHKFENGGFLSTLSATAWYVGYNGRGGRSLYHIRQVNNSGNMDTTAEEIAEGVTDLQIQYLERDAAGTLATSYVDASSVTDWSRVVAARLTFTLQSLEKVGIGGSPLSSSWMTVVTLRNRQS